VYRKTISQAKRGSVSNPAGERYRRQFEVHLGPYLQLDSVRTAERRYMHLQKWKRMPVDPLNLPHWCQVCQREFARRSAEAPVQTPWQVRFSLDALWEHEERICIFRRPVAQSRRIQERAHVCTVLLPDDDLDRSFQFYEWLIFQGNMWILALISTFLKVVNISTQIHKLHYLLPCGV
jgi:hypothetical protein